MRKRLQIFCLLLLPCLTLMGILGRGSPAALSASSDAAIRRTMSGADSIMWPTTKKAAGALCFFSASKMASVLPFS